MICPVCKSGEVEVPTIDVGMLEEIQCGPAYCLDCNAYQDSEDPTRWYEGTTKSDESLTIPEDPPDE